MNLGLVAGAFGELRPGPRDGNVSVLCLSLTGPGLTREKPPLYKLLSLEDRATSVIFLLMSPLYSNYGVKCLWYRVISWNRLLF